MNGNKLNLTIRKIEFEDIPTLVEYRLFYLAELQNEKIETAQSRLKADLENYFQKVMQENRFVAFLAEDDKEIVSYGVLIIKEIPGDFRKPTYLEGDILNMYTIPKARKKGISTAILNKLIEEAKTRRVSKLVLYASKDGENMYRNFGFSEPEYPYLEMVLNSKNFTH